MFNRCHPFLQPRRPARLNELLAPFVRQKPQLRTLQDCGQFLKFLFQPLGRGHELVQGLLQIGAGASVRAKILEPEKVLLAIGAEVVVERPNKEAIEFLKERIMEMEASQKKVAETLDRLRSQMNEINKRLEAGYQQSMAAGQE